MNEPEKTNLGAESLDLAPFSENDFTDIELVVEGRKLFTSRSLLALASPVFSCMFTADFKEKKERVIALPHKEYDAVCEMLGFLDPGVEFRITRDNVFRLIPLAEEYQISVLKTACERALLQQIKGPNVEHYRTKSVCCCGEDNPQFLEQMFPTSEYLVTCLEIAETYSLHALMARCVYMMAQPDISLKELKENGDISLHTKSRIFEERIERLEYDKAEAEEWKRSIFSVKQRLRDIITQHDDHCRCRVEIKLRTAVQRVCPYCTRNWCTDNVSTDPYRNSYKFHCNHKVGFHISHDATIRAFINQDDSL